MAETDTKKVLPVVRTVEVGARNYRTTLAGAGLSTLYYNSVAGPHLPQSNQDWINFAVSIVIFILGLLAKDASTGSQP